jgi:methionyl-tRNA synthetase
VAARYLLLPMQPTPNGRLHIGHGGGPYLRADVLARALRRSGHHVAVITGSDAYENWVLADGHATGRSPAETCALFHTGIKDDLDLLGVELDDWIDPLSPDHANRYIAQHEDLLRRLIATGAAYLDTERVPLNASTGEPAIGTWIAGRCPSCQAPCGGNTCTSCGDHFQPEELLDARSRLDDAPLIWTERTNWFIKPPDPAAIRTALTATGLSEQFRGPAHRYLTRNSGRIRLSQPGNWGVPSTQVPPGSVLSNTYYAYCHYAGHLDAARRGPETPNSLAADSGTTVVGLFGTDNSIAGLVAPHVLAAATAGHFKPLDHTVVNHMLHFEGHKCSTSKRHGPSIRDLRTPTTLTSDELRWVLAHQPLDHHISDATRTEINHHLDRLRRWRTSVLEPRLAALDKTPPLPFRDDALRHALTRQRHHLTPESVDLAAAVRETQIWLDANLDTSTPADVYAWLLGTALLADPLMPALAATLRNSLGHAGSQPTLPALPIP